MRINLYWMPLLLVCNFGFASNAAWSAEDCDLGAPTDTKCIDVNSSWSIFRSVVNSAQIGDFLVFCPFSIYNTNDIAAEPTKRSAFFCQKEGECIIQGHHQSVVINQPEAETLFWGFVFQNASDSAIHIQAASKLPQAICNCAFRNNNCDQRGSALRSEADTLVLVHRSLFMSNTAARGGAIYARGIINVTRCAFVGNGAIQGGAISFASYGSIRVEDSIFENNQALVGPHIYGDVSTKVELRDQFIDEGGNIAVGDSCLGIVNRFMGDVETCQEFNFTESVILWDNYSRSPFSSEGSSLLPTQSSQPSTTPSVLLSREVNQPSTNRSISSDQPQDPQEQVLSLVSRDQPIGYYNFNVGDPDFGPDAWWKVDVSFNEYSNYAKSGLDVSQNECKRDHQSPIDLNLTNTECEEFHQIRARGGDWIALTTDGEIAFRILPSHLRIQIDSKNVDAPRADTPGGFVELYADHLEITSPSLHTLDGRRYDAEYSIFHVQGDLNRVLIMSVLVDASDNEYNNEFQKILDAFSEVQECGFTEPLRLLRSEDFEWTKENEKYTNDGTQSSNEHQTARLREVAQIPEKFNIYNIDLVPSIYWYAYNGSLARPPCSRLANWRVMDISMKISVGQLDQLQDLLVKGPCSGDLGNVGLEDGRARPIQSSGGRKVWRCTATDYKSDCERFGRFCPSPDFP